MRRLGRQHIHYLQVVLSNQEMYQPGLFSSPSVGDSSNTIPVICRILAPSANVLLPLNPPLLLISCQAHLTTKQFNFFSSTLIHLSTAFQLGWKDAIYAILYASSCLLQCISWRGKQLGNVSMGKCFICFIQSCACFFQTIIQSNMVPLVQMSTFLGSRQTCKTHGASVHLLIAKPQTWG